MSQLRKRKHSPETGWASTAMAVIQNGIWLRLKVERRMASPFLEKLPDSSYIAPKRFLRQTSYTNTLMLLDRARN